MCFARRIVLGVFLGQKHIKLFQPIYYASKKFINAQCYYIVKEQEILAAIYSIEKFLAYWLGTNVLVQTNHASLQYLMEKIYAKI